MTPLTDQLSSRGVGFQCGTPSQLGQSTVNPGGAPNTAQGAKQRSQKENHNGCRGRSQDEGVLPAKPPDVWKRGQEVTYAPTGLRL